jgi:hypothetical protein
MPVKTQHNCLVIDGNCVVLAPPITSITKSPRLTPDCEKLTRRYHNNVLHSNQFYIRPLALKLPQHQPHPLNVLGCELENLKTIVALGAYINAQLELVLLLEQ